MVIKKTLSKSSKLSMKEFVPVRSTQDAVPIDRVYQDGIFVDREGFYSKTFNFSDINYTELSDDEKEGKIVDYSSALNSLDKGIHAQISIVYRKIKEEQFRDDVMIPLCGDELDESREQMNDMLLSQVSGSVGMLKECYLTISDKRRNLKDADAFFQRMEGTLMDGFKKVGGAVKPVSLHERLRLLSDMLRPGLEKHFAFDYEQSQRFGQSFKDSIAPLVLDDLTSGDHLKIGDKYCRSLFLNHYPTYLDDRIITTIASINKQMIFSINFVPIPMAEAVSLAEGRSAAAATKVVAFNLKQQRRKNFSGMVPYSLTGQVEGTNEVWTDIKERDQNLYLATVTVTHFADSMEELDSDTEEIYSKAESSSCKLLPLLAQQLHGLNSSLPYGRNYVVADRLLTTQALAGLCPFAAQEIYHPGGVWVGNNTNTKRPIIPNRHLLVNGNSIITSTSGGGKSFYIKEEAAQIALKSDADIVFLDPEREYIPLTRMLKGEVVVLSPSTPNAINPFELDADYSTKNNPVKAKTDFVMSFCEMLTDSTGGIDSNTKTVIDRCSRKMYAPLVRSKFTAEQPTLKDFQRILKEQPEPEAKDLALRLEMYTEGSYDIFARQTNVNTKARIIDYDISALGKHMEDIGMLVLMESIYTRLSKNRQQGRETYIFVDEIMSLFKHDYSADHFQNLWQRVRKRAGFIIGATQNVTQLLQNEKSCALLQNSEISVMLYQSARDRDALANMFGLSVAQKKEISVAENGRGLIKVGNTIVPFTNVFPESNPLYKVMSTKLSDGDWTGGE